MTPCNNPSYVIKRRLQDKLSEEVLEMIFAFADAPTQASICLASDQFHRIVIPLLYRNIHLNSEARCERFCGSIAIYPGDSLKAPLVLSINISLDEVAPFSGEAHPAVAHLGAESSDRSVLLLFNCFQVFQHLTNVTNFRYVNDDMSSSANYARYLPLLHLFPELQSLEMRCDFQHPHDLQHFVAMTTNHQQLRVLDIHEALPPDPLQPGQIIAYLTNLQMPLLEVFSGPSVFFRTLLRHSPHLKSDELSFGVHNNLKSLIQVLSVERNDLEVLNLGSLYDAFEILDDNCFSYMACFRHLWRIELLCNYLLHLDIMKARLETFSHYCPGIDEFDAFGIDAPAVDKWRRLGEGDSAHWVCIETLDEWPDSDSESFMERVNNA